jgi:hypothetical protein
MVTAVTVTGFYADMRRETDHLFEAIFRHPMVEKLSAAVEGFSLRRPRGHRYADGGRMALLVEQLEPRVGELSVWPAEVRFVRVDVPEAHLPDFDDAVALCWCPAAAGVSPLAPSAGRCCGRSTTQPKCRGSRGVTHRVQCAATAPP